MSEKEQYGWSGQLIDANGRQGSIEMSLDSEKGAVTWRLKLLERDGKPVEIDGQSGFDGQSIEKGLSLRTSDKLPDGGTVEWELNLERADAAQYARAALVGTYRATAEGAEGALPLSTGIVALWQFA